MSPRFDLYNLAGQVVRRMGEGRKAPGEYSLRWDMRDVSGRRVPAGTYILQMRAEGYVGRRRVVVIE